MLHMIYLRWKKQCASVFIPYWTTSIDWRTKFLVLIKKSDLKLNPNKLNWYSNNWCNASFNKFTSKGNEIYLCRCLFYLRPSLSILFPMFTAFISCSKFPNSAFWTVLTGSLFFSRWISSQVSLNVEKICDEIRTILFNSFNLWMSSVSIILLWISTPLKGSSRMK